MWYYCFHVKAVFLVEYLGSTGFLKGPPSPVVVEENLLENWNVFLCELDVLPATQPSVSKC